MKGIRLQLVTLNLEDGTVGTFVGVPLVTEETPEQDCQIEDIWFSDTQTIPEDMTVAQLVSLMQRQLCHCQGVLQ